MKSRGLSSEAVTAWYRGTRQFMVAYCMVRRVSGCSHSNSPTLIHVSQALTFLLNDHSEGDRLSPGDVPPFPLRTGEGRNLEESPMVIGYDLKQPKSSEGSRLLGKCAAWVILQKSRRVASLRCICIRYWPSRMLRRTAHASEWARRWGGTRRLVKRMGRSGPVHDEQGITGRAYVGDLVAMRARRWSIWQSHAMEEKQDEGWRRRGQGEAVGEGT
ncbi:hypothetical protein C8Q78DRAFT_1003086 [Trametes maxima]|nr:hypothetical protein C8Q78DRAFT_1003086 [Trametes maxima]